MNQGWVKLHRSLLDWEWFDDANCTRLFLYCLLKANHKDQKWKGLEIKRGAFFTGLDSLKSETGLTVSQIRTAIRKLEMTGELTSKSQAGGRMITVVAYDQYQADDKQNDTKIAEGSQDDDKRVTANKNDKKEKNEENEKKITSTQKPKVICPHREILNLWDKKMPSYIARPQDKNWNSKRAAYKHLQARWGEVVKEQGEDKSLEWFERLFEYIAKQNSFLTNPESKWFKLDWVVKSENFIKITEGSYQDG